ncbi:hypothetical protein BBJ28_00001681 [Nothophytophthora sp. Chile5]|nr:hypothetical protein BBJ28_00001681 [Nothophytophthora sp. Chile5]
MVPAHCCGVEFPTEYVKDALGALDFTTYARYLAERQWQQTSLRSDAEYAKTVQLLGGMQCPRCGIGVTRISGCEHMNSAMTEDAFVVVLLKPEIATGCFKFATNGATHQAVKAEDASDSTQAEPSAAASSSIAGVSNVEAAFLLPNGRITSTVLSRIKESGFEITQRRIKQLSRSEARQLFLHELQQRLAGDEQAFAAFLTAVTCGPSLALLLKLPGTAPTSGLNAAIKKWDHLVGPWDPVIARKQALAASVPHDQWPLRALCGLNALQNGLSSSADVCCARRERFLLFPPATPQLERATIVLFPTFHSNSRELLLSKLGHEVSAVILTTTEGYQLSSDDVLRLCGLPRNSDQSVCDQVKQVANQVVEDKGVEVLLLEGLDLSYTLRAVVGPANVELARQFFPDSVRAQVPNKLQTVELPVDLHPAEDDALGFESGLFLSFDPKLRLEASSDSSREGFAGVPERGEPVERTLGLIKPNAASKPEVVDEILRMINQFGFTVERQRRLRLSRDQAGAFYAEHRGKPFFETLLSFMTSGDIVALELSRSHAIRVWRAIMGPTNSLKARETHPWTLRARFGVDGTRNATHGSDSSASAARELRFFFGSALSPSSISIHTMDLPADLTARAVAQRPIVVSGSAGNSIEKVLTQGLKELVARNLSDPLEACRWLGEWLLSYQSRGLEYESAIPNGPVKPDLSIKAGSSVVKTLVESPSETRKVVAVSLEATMDVASRTLLVDILHERLDAANYVIVDVAREIQSHTAVDTAVANIMKILKDSGRRRCVLFDCGELASTSAFCHVFQAQAPTDWQINFIVRLGPEPSPATHGSLMDVPSLYVALFAVNSTSLRDSDALQGLFQTVFDPYIVILADPQLLLPVQPLARVAKRFGFYLLTFDVFIATLKATIDSPKEAQELLSLVQSGAKVPSPLLLTVLRRSILGTQGSSSTDTQKFLLLGFPWADILPIDLENAIGRPQSVLLVGASHDRFQTATNRPEPPLWTAAFRKRGLLKRLWVDSPLDSELSTVSRALTPAVGFFLGECADHKQLETLQTVAEQHEYLWIDCTAPKLSNLSKLMAFLLRPHAGHEKFLLYGFPQTSNQLSAFLETVGSPHFIVHSSSSNPPVAQDLLDVFNSRPEVVQLDLAGAAEDAKASLQGLLFRKKVVTLVGNVDVLDLPQLRDAVAPLGYDVLDVRQQRSEGETGEEQHLRELVRRIQAVQAPRCLVVGASEIPSFYHALERHIGHGMHQILMLQSVKVRPNTSDGNDDDFVDDSDEDDAAFEADGEDGGDVAPSNGGIKWRKLSKALSPQLSQLLEAISKAPNSSILVDVLGFLESTPRGATRVVQDLVTRLRPRLLGVVGHPFTFYRNAARNCCRRRQVGFVDFSDGHSSNSEVSDYLRALEKLQDLVRTTSYSIYFLDGFPRVSNPANDAIGSGSSTPQPRYAAQQLWELNRRLAPLAGLVRFATALEVLEDRAPPGVTRSMLDDAQDDLDATAGGLIELLQAPGPQWRPVYEVTCDRTLQDAQDELDDVLQQLLKP